jgi:hypothetical protein
MMARRLRVTHHRERPPAVLFLDTASTRNRAGCRCLGNTMCAWSFSQTSDSLAPARGRVLGDACQGEADRALNGHLRKLEVVQAVFRKLREDMLRSPDQQRVESECCSPSGMPRLTPLFSPRQAKNSGTLVCLRGASMCRWLPLS